MATRLTVAEQIAARNKIWKKASKKQKRVLIAKDALEQIRRRRYMVTNGKWVDVEVTDKQTYDHYKLDRWLVDVADAGSRSEQNRSLQEFFLDETKEKKTCACCGVGALFMSCTLFNNTTTLGHYFDEVAPLGSTELGAVVADANEKFKLSNQLTQFFSVKQLQLVEAAFELGDGAVFTDLKWLDEQPKSTRAELYEEQAAQYGRKHARDLEAAVRFGMRYDDAKKRLCAILKNIVKNDGTFVPPPLKKYVV